MDYPGYEKDLYHIYESEVLGETMFGLIAQLSWDAGRKRKWRALAQLETQTKQRYLDYVADKPLFNEKPRPSRLLGLVYGLIFALLPWKTAMKMLADGTGPFMDVFQRLQQHAAPEDEAFFSYVVAHEVAIKRFADCELSGDCAESLAAVDALLEPST